MELRGQRILLIFFFVFLAVMKAGIDREENDQKYLTKKPFAENFRSFFPETWIWDVITLKYVFKFQEFFKNYNQILALQVMKKSKFPCRIR